MKSVSLVIWRDGFTDIFVAENMLSQGKYLGCNKAVNHVFVKRRGNGDERVCRNVLKQWVTGP